MSVSSNFKFIRSTEMENEATRQILSLFTTAWADTSKKSARDLMSLVLQTIQGACSVAQNTGETEESIQLKHANQYFEKLVKLFDSSDPLPMEISGNTFDDMIRNLNRIKSYAANEEYGQYITDRIDFFVRKCIEKNEEMAHNEKHNTISRLVIGGISGALLAGLFFLLGIAIGIDLGGPLFILLLITFIAMGMGKAMDSE